MTTIAPVHYDPLDPATVRAPWDVYRQLRDLDPLHRVDVDRVRTGPEAHRLAPRDFWVLSRFEDVFRAARDTETFSSAQGLSFQGGDIDLLGLVPTVVMMDPPDHTAFRRLVSRGFTPRRVADVEPAVRAFVVERVEALRSELAAGGEADLIGALAKPLPSFVVATYLGVPEADRARFDGWSSAIVSANAGGDVLTDARDAVGELYDYFRHLIERRRSEPVVEGSPDMIATLAHARLDGEALTPEAILGYAFVMIAGGNDTTTGLLGGAAELLTEFPDQRARLLDDPGLIPGAVEELLRLTSPVQGLSRTTTRPVAIHGVDLPEGAKVHLLYASANRDPREFGRTAEELDVSRPVPRMMTFSSGPHHCLGAAAARLQGCIALEELLARIPTFAVDAERGRFAPGAFVRRYEHLPVRAA